MTLYSLAKKKGVEGKIVVQDVRWTLPWPDAGGKLGFLQRNPQCSQRGEWQCPDDGDDVAL